MTRYFKKIAIFGSLFFAYPPLAIAAENAPFIRGDELCHSASFILEYHHKFRTLSADKIDTVRMVPTARLITTQAIPHFPQRVFTKDGDIITPFKVQPNGEIADFGRLTTASSAIEICTFDPARNGLLNTEDGLKWDIDMDIIFLSADGEHKIETLRDGLRDGRSHYKKVAGALSLVVPKMTHLLIKPVGEISKPRPIAIKQSDVLPPLTLGTFCSADLISMKELESQDAEKLIITGGSYRLLPVPNAKALERFAGCDDKN